MDESLIRASIRKYFKKFPTWAVILSVIGLLIVLSSAQSSAGGVLFGLVLLGIGAVGIWMALGGKPSDEQMDAWLRDDLAKLSKTALAKLGLDETETIGDPVTVHGPIMWSTGGIQAKDLVSKKGKDGVARFGVYRCNIIHLSEKNLGSYSCTYNFLKGTPVGEETDEYFYKDVVSVATKTESTSLVLPNGQKMDHSETFQLTTSGGTSIKVVISDPKLSQFTGNATIPTTSAEKAVAAIRKMLRDKKG
jgi:hypothetical protein